MTKTKKQCVISFPTYFFLQHRYSHFKQSFQSASLIEKNSLITNFFKRNCHHPSEKKCWKRISDQNVLNS